MSFTFLTFPKKNGHQYFRSQTYLASAILRHQQNLTCHANRLSRYTKEGALRHSGRANMVFADGHVKNIGWRELLTRNADNVAPWMMDWADCNPNCPAPVAGPAECFDPGKLP